MKNVNDVKFKDSEIAQANVAIKFLSELRKVAVAKQIRATHAVAMLAKAHPKMPRTTVGKAALFMGINRGTACKVWDTIHYG